MSNPTRNPEARQDALESTLLTLSPDPDETLRSLVWTSRTLEGIQVVLRGLNCDHDVSEEQRFPVETVPLLRRLVRCGADRERLGRLLMQEGEHDPEGFRVLLEQVGEEVGGLVALLVLVETKRNTTLDLLRAFCPEDEDYFALLKDFSRVDPRRFPRLPKQPLDAVGSRMEHYRFALCAVLQDTTRREERDADASEREVYNEEITDRYNMPCYAVIEPGRTRASGGFLTLSLVLPMVDRLVRAAEVVRVPLDRAAEFDSFLELPGTTLGELAASGGSFRGEAVVTLLVTEGSGRGRLPLIYRAHAVR